MSQGGYWLIAGLMALESTLVPIPSEVIIPPAAYLAHTQGQLSFVGVVLAGTAGSWLGACRHVLGGALAGPAARRAVWAVTSAWDRQRSRWRSAGRARYGSAGVFFSRLLPVIRHLIGIPGGNPAHGLSLVRARHAAGSLLWCSVLAWLGRAVGQHPELLAGSLHRFFALVVGVAAILGVLYYVFVQRASARTRL